MSTPHRGASHRPPDSPTRPETPPDGTPVAPEPSEGDTGADRELLIARQRNALNLGYLHDLANTKIEQPSLGDNDQWGSGYRAAWVEVREEVRRLRSVSGGAG